MRGRIGRRMRGGLTYANVMATAAVFVVLGGSAYAAQAAITGADVRNGSLTGQDIRNGSVASADIRDGSLRARDIRGGSLPRGPQGAPAR